VTEAIASERRYGAQSMWAPLRRVLVRAPDPASVAAWHAFGWRGEPDPVRLAEEHEAFRALLADAGAEVVTAGTPLGLSPDAIYVYDPALVTDRGAVLLRPGKDGRRVEVATMAADLVEAGVPIATQLDAPAQAEGGDTIWLDERTLLVGVGYRTNEAGVGGGGREVLHLMSLVSPLDRDLAVAYLPLLPVRLVQLLAERAIQLVEVPEDEFWTMGPNVLALAPRVALALDGNPVTRRRMEAAGVDVRVYAGDQLSRLGDGGPTCLTRPLLRS
jgi:dimethylargininase